MSRTYSHFKINSKKRCTIQRIKQTDSTVKINIFSDKYIALNGYISR
ncbi:MAG: hypothetical protein ACI85O_002616 [Saprospiraceae bacterium]|jgi:hypothetical protein